MKRNEHKNKELEFQYNMISYTFRGKHKTGVTFFFQTDRQDRQKDKQAMVEVKCIPVTIPVRNGNCPKISNSLFHTF